jgi:hypothetical protein
MSVNYDRDVYFDMVRQSPFGGGMTQDQVDGQNALLAAIEGDAYTDHWKNAYVMATAFHETAFTMQPIAEYGKGSGREYGQPCSSCGGQKPYGRGYVQLTWCDNYRRADDELDLKDALWNDFELALDPDIAADIILKGMHQGWFTGKKCSDYINIDTGKKDYYNARRIVNGTDKASTIAGYADAFEAAMVAAAEAYQPPEEGPEEPETPERPNMGWEVGEPTLSVSVPIKPKPPAKA